jgi:hypothetical protein
MTDFMEKAGSSEERIGRWRCPLCEGPVVGTVRALRDHISGEVFQVGRCPNCEVLFVTDPPSEARIGSYYENEAGSLMHRPPGRLFRAMRKVSIARDLRHVLRRLPAGARVVDFGAGDGSVSAFLQERGFRVQAFDVYEEPHWRCPQVPYRQFRPGAGPLTPDDLRCHGGSPDAVVLRHVLEHLHDPLGAMRLFRSVPVGLVMAIVPNVESPMVRWLGDDWFYWDPPRHLTFFSQKALGELGRHAGYDLLEARTGGLDEVATAAYRHLLLKGPAIGRPLSPSGRRLVHSLRPTGLIAGISSALAAPVGRSVLLAVYESRR